MIALVLPLALPALEKVVEFLSQGIEQSVRLFALNRGNQVGTPNLNLGGGGVVVLRAEGLILVKTNVDPTEALKRELREHVGKHIGAIARPDSVRELRNPG